MFRMELNFVYIQNKVPHPFGNHTSYMEHPLCIEVPYIYSHVKLQVPSTKNVRVMAFLMNGCFLLRPPNTCYSAKQAINDMC